MCAVEPRRRRSCLTAVGIRRVRTTADLDAGMLRWPSSAGPAPSADLLAPDLLRCAGRSTGSAPAICWPSTPLSEPVPASRRPCISELARQARRRDRGPDAGEHSSQDRRCCLNVDRGQSTHPAAEQTRQEIADAHSSTRCPIARRISSSSPPASALARGRDRPVGVPSPRTASYGSSANPDIPTRSHPGQPSICSRRPPRPSTTSSGPAQSACLIPKRCDSSHDSQPSPGDGCILFWPLAAKSRRPFCHLRPVYLSNRRHGEAIA